LFGHQAQQGLQEVGLRPDRFRPEERRRPLRTLFEHCGNGRMQQEHRDSIGEGVEGCKGRLRETY